MITDNELWSTVTFGGNVGASIPFLDDIGLTPEGIGGVQITFQSYLSNGFDPDDPIVQQLTDIAIPDEFGVIVAVSATESIGLGGILSLSGTAYPNWSPADIVSSYSTSITAQAFGYGGGIVLDENNSLEGYTGLAGIGFGGFVAVVGETLAIGVNTTFGTVIHTTSGTFRYDLSTNSLIDITDEYTSQYGLNNQCFLFDVPISMWPIDPSVKPRFDGTYNEKLVLSKVWTKPISEIAVGDLVISYDDKGRIKPGPVTRTMQNRTTHILEFWGTGVTPGHAYYCADGKFKGQYVPLMDILRTDGAIVRDNGTLIRAATGCEVGSVQDQMIHAVVGDKKLDGSIKPRERAQIRLGTRIICSDNEHRSIYDLITASGGQVTNDGYIQISSDGLKMPFRWMYSESLPKPEDYILNRSKLTLDEIYAAGEWEQIGTRMSAPAGQIASHEAEHRPHPKPVPNIPPAFATRTDVPVLFATEIKQ